METRKQRDEREEREEGSFKNDVKEMVVKMESALSTAGCNCDSKYCPLTKAFSLIRKYGIPFEEMAELLVSMGRKAREKLEANVFEESVSKWDL